MRKISILISCLILMFSLPACSSKHVDEYAQYYGGYLKVSFGMNWEKYTLKKDNKFTFESSLAKEFAGDYYISNGEISICYFDDEIEIFETGAIDASSLTILDQVYTKCFKDKCW